MKIKTFSFLSGLFIMFILNSGFVETEIKPQTLDGGKVSFAKFLSHFDKVDTPFEINLGNKHKYENQVAKAILALKKPKSKKVKIASNRMELKDYIPELKSGMFSRSGPPEVLPIARFYPNNKMIAVVYLTYQPFRGSKTQEYNMALYDLRGKLIHTNKQQAKKKKGSFDYYAGFSLAYNSYQETETFAIDEEGQIWKNTYKNIWKEDTKKNGYQDNEIIGYDLKDTQVFQIQTNGLVEASKAYNVDDRASID